VLRKSLEKKKKLRKGGGKEEGLLGEGMKSPPSLSAFLSFFLSVRSDRAGSGEGAVKPGCQSFLSEPEQKTCPDKRLRVME